MLLKIHTYFMWPNTKMNTHFFMEDKDKLVKTCSMSSEQLNPRRLAKRHL